MKHLIILLALTSLFGCTKKTEQKPAYVATEQGRIAIPVKDPREILLFEFRQTTQYPELADDDLGNGTFNYWYYETNDFLNVSFGGVTNQDIINGALEEFKSVMKKRNVDLPIKVSVYEKTIRTSDTTTSSTGLIREFEIK